MDTLASRLKTARKARGLTQASLAKLAGVGQSAIGNIESGKRGGLQSLTEIAMALNVNYLWLRDGEGEMDVAPMSAAIFSREVVARLLQLPADDRRKIENSVRAALDMDPLPRAHQDQPLGGSFPSTGTHG
jgi:transcriptional regulator with XRE-family HTH domain